MNNLLNFIKTGPINTVALVPPAIALFLVVAWGLLRDRLFMSVPQIFSYAILSIAFILVGSVGLIYIYRKEMPGPISSTTIKGTVAIITGYILFIFFSVLGILAFLFTLLY